MKLKTTTPEEVERVEINSGPTLAKTDIKETAQHFKPDSYKDPSLLTNIEDFFNPKPTMLEQQVQDDIAKYGDPGPSGANYFKANAKAFNDKLNTLNEYVTAPRKVAEQLATGTGGFTLGLMGGAGSLTTDAFKAITDVKGILGIDEHKVTREKAANNLRNTFEGINESVNKGVDNLLIKTGVGTFHSKPADYVVEKIGGLLDEILHPIHITGDKLKEAGLPLVGELFKIGGEIVALGELHSKIAPKVGTPKSDIKKIKGTATDINLLKDKAVKYNETISKAEKAGEIKKGEFKKVNPDSVHVDPVGVSEAIKSYVDKISEAVSRQEQKMVNDQRALYPTEFPPQAGIGEMFKDTPQLAPTTYREKFTEVKPKQKPKSKPPLTEKEAIKIVNKVEKPIKAARRSIPKKDVIKDKPKAQIEREKLIEKKKKESNKIRSIRREYSDVSYAVKSVKGEVPELDILNLRKERTRLYSKRPKTIREFDENLSKLKQIEAILDKHAGKPEITIPDYKVSTSVKRGILTPEEGAVIGAVLERFKKQPKIDITGRRKNMTNLRTGETAIKDPRHFFHEVGHQIFEHILTSKDRLEFMELMRKYTPELSKRKKLRTKLSEYNNMEITYAGESKTLSTNTNSNYHEYFAEQFSQYINNKVLSEPQFRTIMQRAVNYLRDIIEKARKNKLYDKELQPFFDKIIHANDKVVKPSKPATAKPTKLTIKDMIEINKKRQAKKKIEAEQRKLVAKEERDRIKDEYYDEMIDELSDYIDPFDDLMFRDEKIVNVTKEQLATKMQKEFDRKQLEVDIARDNLAKAPKTVKGYSQKLTQHFNEVMHEAQRLGIGFDEVYKRMGVKDYELKSLTAEASKYAELRVKEYEKIRGKQVNDIWKDKKAGILNTPIYNKDIIDIRRLTDIDLKPTIFTRAFTLPDIIFDKFGPEIKELFLGKVDNAYDIIAKEKSQMTKRLKIVKKMVKGKQKELLNNYMFAEQHFGKAYLDGLGKKIPKWEELDSGAQLAYEYMRKQYEQFYDRINMARRMNGQKPFGKQDNYATMMRDFKAMEEAGTFDIRMAPEKFAEYQKAERLRESKFNWNKKRNRLVDKEGNPVALYEMDAFKVLDRYSSDALNAIYLNPVVKYFDTMLDHQVKVKIDGKVKKRKLIKLQNPVAYNWLFDYNQRIARNRPKHFFEELGKKESTGLRWVDTGLAYINQSLTAAYLSASARLAITQFSAISNTLAIAPIDVPLAIFKSMKPGHRSKIFAKSKRMFSRIAGGDAHLNDLKSAVFDRKSKFGKYKSAMKIASEKGLVLTHAIDSLVARISWESFYSQAKRKGLTEHEAIRYADSYTTLTQSSGDIAHRAPIQTGTAGKFFTLFQTFAISQYNLLRHDIGASLIGKGAKAKGGKIHLTAFEKSYLKDLEARGVKGNIKSDKVIRELRNARQLAEVIAKASGVKDVRRISKMDATRMVLGFIVAKSLIDSIYEEGLGVSSPNPTPVRDMIEKYNKSRSKERNSQAMITLAKGFGEYLPVISSSTYGGGFGGAGYDAIADVFGSDSGSGLIKAASNLTLIPGIGTYRTFKDAAERGEENPFYYLVRKKNVRRKKNR